ncbi:AMP-binding protein [Allosphingosinicella deserti]|uniref:AMP-binding protein n=1 Tax=Allosphingosinicella deserti TaxID=2116704 RepID=UPI0013048839|nr:AMP-binding protein [Sphingomonas deserti]
MNVLEAFARQVADHPDRPAIIDGRGRTTTYVELDRRAAALASAWRARGLKRGDRVLIALPLDADLYAGLAALWRIGAAAVLPEPALGLYGLRHAVAATAPRALLAAGLYRLLPWIAPAVRRIPLRLGLGHAAGHADPEDVPPDTPALISFTSGTSGAPKAIVRTHDFLVAQDAAVAPLIDARGRPEVDLVAFPVFVIANLGQGITSVLPNWRLRDPAGAAGAAIRSHAERHGVSRLLLSPALAERLAKSGFPSGAHTLFTGGGPVFPDLVARIAEAAPALRTVSVYGSTEAEPIAHVEASHISAGDWAEMRRGAGLLAGTPSERARVRIVEDEIWVAGGHVVSGYLDPAHDRSTKVRDDQGITWHKTGDGGRFDEAGRLWLRGRIDARVGTLWPFEVEARFRLLPGVERAALCSRASRPVVAIEGDAACLPVWRDAADDMRAEIVHISRIPMDRRHGSKVDKPALQRLVER